MSPRKRITYSQHPNHAARSAHAKGEKAFRTYDTSFIRPKRSPVPAIIGGVVLIVLLAAIVFGVLTFSKGCSPNATLEQGQQVEITVADGEGINSVGKTLASVGLIGSPNEFTDRVNALGADGTIQPGTYTFTGGQSVDEMIKAMQPAVASETFTVPEGSTIEATAEIVAKASDGRIKAEDFTKAASDASKYADSYDFVKDAGDRSLEGFLFPKTYPINDDSTADSIIRMMLDQYATETESVDWSYAEEHDLSHYDALKLASIVEKEASADNRATVASVFYNRLAEDMRLQSDATVAYFVKHDPTPEDVETENEYNTYTIDGLPPTPINSPSLACIEAVCAPEDTNYLYFYFAEDEEGNLQYNFTETYEEHQATYE